MPTRTLNPEVSRSLGRLPYGTAGLPAVIQGKAEWSDVPVRKRRSLVEACLEAGIGDPTTMPLTIERPDPQRAKVTLRTENGFVQWFTVTADDTSDVNGPLILFVLGAPPNIDFGTLRSVVSQAVGFQVPPVPAGIEGPIVELAVAWTNEEPFSILFAV